MARAQGQLPLPESTSTAGTSLRQVVLALIKAFRKATTQLEKLKRPSSLDETLLVLNRSIAALRAIGLEDAIHDLDGVRAALVQSRDEALKARREELLRAAKEAGWRVRRLKNYDFVGCFQVNYRHHRVTLRLGSEILDSFDEADGASLFSRLRTELGKLDQFPFSRSQFMEAIKGALSLARIRGVDRNGRVPVRKLYPLVVLVRQSQDPRFLKRPGVKHFVDYPIAQFVYDLARFGRNGWRNEQGERLCNQPPNMGSIAKGATVTLPSLEGDGSGRTQIGSVWVGKR